jgi:hypothetical protein
MKPNGNLVGLVGVLELSLVKLTVKEFQYFSNPTIEAHFEPSSKILMGS